MESWQGTLHKFNHKNVMITCRSQHREDREDRKVFTWIKGRGKMPWWTAGHMPSRVDRTGAKEPFRQIRRRLGQKLGRLRPVL